MTQLPRDFKEFLQLLNSKKVDYLLVGGYAVGYYGYPRSTGDMDIWIAIHPRNAERVVEVLKEFGFGLPNLSADIFLREERIIRMGISPFRIEVFTTISGVDFDECYSKRVTDVVDGIEIKLINLEDLNASRTKRYPNCLKTVLFSRCGFSVAGELGICNKSERSMENDEITDLLGRIAVALERIANTLSDERTTDAGLNGEELEITYKDNGVLENTKEEECDVIEHFLDSRGIAIKSVPPEDAADKVINSLSEFLGKNYDGLRELLIKIKRSMQQGGFITLSIKDYTQKEVSNVCQFSTRLHEIAFLEQYKYFKSPQYQIKAKTTTLPIAQNFFSGKWLERFVLLSVQRAVDLVSKEIDTELEFSYLLNPQIILPNGNDFELDLIFHINGLFYWVEAKSGDYQQHISKYSKISKILNLDFKHSIMALTDVSADRFAALTSLFSMTVSSLPQLEEMLIEIIKADHVV